MQLGRFPGIEEDKGGFPIVIVKRWVGILFCLFVLCNIVFVVGHFMRLRSPTSSALLEGAGFTLAIRRNGAAHKHLMKPNMATAHVAAWLRGRVTRLSRRLC